MTVPMGAVVDLFEIAPHKVAVLDGAEAEARK